MTFTNTPTSLATTTPMPTPTVPSVVLPPVSAQPDAPGTIVQQTIDSSGGTLVTGDGRAALVFPQGALSAAATVSIRDLTPSDNPPAITNSALINAWQFSAVDAANPAQTITAFAQPVTAVLRLGASESFRYNASTLRLWTLDPVANQWQPVPAGVDAQTSTLTATLAHFSVYGLSANPNVDQAPFSDGAAVDLHAGAATLAVPIAVPAGPGGLTPDLNLSYDSSRVSAMRTQLSLGSWAGTGWQLSTGSISGDLRGNPLYGLDPAGLALSLQMNGVSGRVEYERPDSLWYMSDHTFARIELFNGSGQRIGSLGDPSACVSNTTTPCYWRVTDKHGTQYFFGDVPNQTPATHAVRYMGNPASVYQWDLSRIVDVNNNQITITYAQFGTNTVQDAVPATISWDNGLYTVVFDTTSRADTPVNTNCVGGTFTAPPVEETRQLQDVRVLVQGQLLKKYVFNYTTTPFTIFYDGAGCEGRAGQMTLQTMLEYGSSTTPLRTMTFAYGQSATVTSNVYQGTAGQAWPLLTNWSNGLGGSVAFAYGLVQPVAPPGQSDSCWTQNVVTTKTSSGGAGQPAVVTSYTYRAGPDAEWPLATFGNSCWATNNIYQSQRYLGFGDVKETDALGDVTEHCYNTSRSTNESLMTGRERETWVWGPGGPATSDTLCAEPVGTASVTPLRHVVNTWQSAFLDPCVGPCPTDPSYFPHFVYPLQAATTLQDGSQTYTQNVFDVNSTSPPPSTWYGNLLQTNSFSGTAPSNPTQPPVCGAPSCLLSTYTPYLTDTADWIFVPQYAAKTDPLTSNQLMSCTRFYYDGLSLPGQLPLAPLPVHGLVTAQSTAIAVTPTTATSCATVPTIFTSSTNTYSAYDIYGNVVAASVATATRPETAVQVVPFGASVGWVSSDAPYTATQFSAADNDHVTPSQQINPVLQSTTYTATDLVSFLQGAPAQVQEPNGHVTSTLYDAYGRALLVWDNLDSLASPTRSYTYNWATTFPNQTIVKEKTGSSGGTTTVRTGVTCVDGFGRDVERRQSYLETAFGTLMNSVRTDYDVLGRKAVVTNAVTSGSTSQCETTPSPVGARDRTAYIYDALGNVTQTTSLAANQTTGPSAQVQYGGLMTMSCDEKFDTTKKVGNPVQRMLTVYEPKATRTSCDFTADTSSVNYNATTYANDALGRLTQVTDAYGNQTSLQYDMAGRKTSMTDPDMGHWTYGYYPTGKLQTQTDARGVVSNLAYDALSRLTGKTYGGVTPPGGAMPVTFTYDHTTDGPCPTSQNTLGHLAQMTDSSGFQWSCYDVRGHEAQTQRTITLPSSTYTIYRGFDPLGNVTSLTYPDTEAVTYTYGRQSETLTKVSSSLAPAIPLITQAYVTPWGAPGGLAFGNGEMTRYAYDYRKRVIDIQTGTTLAPANDQHLALTYDDASNVAAVTDKTTGEVAGYTYDQLNRLTAMTLNGVSAAAYGYNAIGNTTSKQEGLNGANPLTNCYPSSGAAAPHAVTKVFQGAQVSCSTTNPWLTLAYDGNGNLASQGTSTYAFDADNRLTSRPDALGGTDSYTYDGNGTLLKRVNANGTWTVYIGGVYEENHSSNGAITGVVKYYQAFGRAVAVRQAPDAMGTQAGVLVYLLADHLGSTVGLVDLNGNVVANSQLKYWPYGAIRSGNVTPPPDRMFTGQQQEAPASDALGLYDYKARFYSTVTGRFVSADSTLDGLNRYSYVHNSPIDHADPTGQTCADAEGKDTCTRDDFIGFVSCAVGNDDCRKPDVAAWVSPEDWMRLSRWVVTQSVFWNRWFNQIEHAYPYESFGAEVALAIARGGVTFDQLNLIPALGWDAIGSHYHVRARFMYYSLYDLANGTDYVVGLPLPEIVGASDWWEDISWQGAWAQAIGSAYDRNHDDLKWVYRSRTEVAYWELFARKLSVDDAANANWSDSQWWYLHDRGYPLAPRPFFPPDLTFPDRGA